MKEIQAFPLPPTAILHFIPLPQSRQGKGKVFLVHPIKAQEGQRSSSTHYEPRQQKKVSGYLHVPVALTAEPQYPLNKRQGGPQRRSGRLERKISNPGQFSKQPSRYSNYASCATSVNKPTDFVAIKDYYCQYPSEKRTGVELSTIK